MKKEQQDSNSIEIEDFRTKSDLLIKNKYSKETLRILEEQGFTKELILEYEEKFLEQQKDWGKICEDMNMFLKKHKNIVMGLGVKNHLNDYFSVEVYQRGIHLYRSLIQQKIDLKR